MEKVNRRYLIISITITMILAVLVATYAYWRGAIQGEGSNMSVELGDAKVIFTDNTIIGNVDIVPGWSVTKTFTIENQGGTTFNYDIYLKDLINTMVTEDFLQYKITSNNNGYNMDDYASIPKSPVPSDFDLATNVSIDAGVTQTYTIEFRYVDSPTVNQNEDMGKKFGGQLMIRENTDKTLYSILSDGKKYKLGERGTFDTVFGETTPNTNGTIKDGYNQTGTIYKTEDNNDYYFAGNPSDNWVKFAGFWWRIIRTNSTEGTRLLYAGTSHDGQDGYINNTTYKWNSNYNQYYYVQWDSYSQLKNTLSSWYTSDITGTNDNMVNSIVYCNDTSYIDQSGWGTNGRSYGAYNRLESAKNPSHTCETNNFGAAAKVGLMTADEVAYAGGERRYNSPNTYYYRNSISSGCTGASGDSCSVTGDNSWWTLSPLQFFNGLARVFNVLGASSSPGYFGPDVVGSSFVVRPVITLKPDVIVTGEGTTDSPYEVKKEKKSFYATLTNGKTYIVDENRNTAATSPIEGTSITQGYNHTGKIYKTGDDYYFAGNPSDNWVYFVDKWWRIIRTNSTEGTRLLYAGTSPEGQDGYINNRSYQWSSDNSLGKNFWSESSIKTTLNAWYTANITGSTDEMVKEIIYCNDISYIDYPSWGTNGRKYGAFTRLKDNKAPNYICEIDTNGFGVRSKVGMMTADEVAFAGGINEQNAPNTYYYRNAKSIGCGYNSSTNNDPCSVTSSAYWWTLSPYNFLGKASMFSVSGASDAPGRLIDSSVDYSYAIRPVITLLPSIKITGSGTTDDPYVPTL